MPTYEYTCLACDARFELVQRVEESEHTRCVDCGGDVRKVIFSPGVIYKGTGFYTTDYVRSTSTPPTSSEAESSSPKSVEPTKESGSRTEEPAP